MAPPAIALLIALGFGGPGYAAEGEQPPPAALQQVVEQSAQRFCEAVEQQDAAAIAALFTEEAEYIDASGVVFHGRAAIDAEFAAAFAASPPGKLAVELLSIRPIAEGVMVEEGASSFTSEEDGTTAQTRYAATHVRQPDGGWLMASVRELDGGQMTPHDRLQELAWLVGDWHEDVDGSAISTAWKWSDDGNFLISEFTIQPSADVTIVGTHRVGWDAQRKQFRSWIFDSGGGFAEGCWRSNEDGSWSVSLSRVDADGMQSSSVLTYQPDGQEAIFVRQDQRVVAGESVPGWEHRVVPKPPEAAVSVPQDSQ